MFGKKKEKKKKGMVDKVVMGAIIGGAIGSVVGITVAPKSGKETRQDIIEAKNKFIEKHGGEIEDAKQEAKKQGSKVWKYIKKALKKNR
ncbi:YtxH domain-containing protein [Patescibacteria group bacterium]